MCGTVVNNAQTHVSKLLRPMAILASHLSSSAGLTKSAEQNLSALATILKAYPKVQVHLADHSGNAEQPNQEFFGSPAKAIRAELVSAGVNPERISTSGFNSARPSPTYGAEQIQLQNRGLELTVTAK
jgi:outer membrane protein OmpA-like peptidoglycan-associated protein